MTTLNITALVRDADHYVVLFDDASLVEALCVLDDWAADEDLNFTKGDASLMAFEVIGSVDKQTKGARR